MKKGLIIFFMIIAILCILVSLFQLLMGDYPKYWWYAPVFFLFAYLVKLYEFPKENEKQNNKDTFENK